MKEKPTKQSLVPEDLKFIRSVIEKTHRAFDPGSPVIIVWGLIFLIGYPATQYFLTTQRLYDFILPVWPFYFGNTIFKGMVVRRDSHFNLYFGSLYYERACLCNIRDCNGSCLYYPCDNRPKAFSPAEKRK